jgi:two-component system, chemotaxis family, response regulator Rcp1
MTRRVRVLLVEDNPGDVDLIRDALEDVAPHLEITVVGDGAEALAYLSHGSGSVGDHVRPIPDLVLLDLNVPKISGHEVLSEIRKTLDLRTLPIVVVTSSDATRDIVTSYNLGANSYVTKPGELAAFQSTVRALGNFWCNVARLPS